MLVAKFECAPSVTALLDAIGEGTGRFLLEDVGRGTAIVGAWPRYVLSTKDGAAVIDDGTRETRLAADPFELLSKHLARFRQEDAPSDVPFAGGAVGYFSYDLGRSIESLPVQATEDVLTPDYRLGFYDSALCIDVPKRTCTAVSWSGDREAANYWRKLALGVEQARHETQSAPVHCPGPPVEVRSNFTKLGYLRAVERVRDYIAAGDVYQVNLSQRFDAPLAGTPWSLYKVLRSVNPAPQSCYMELGKPVLVGASPEVFLTYDPSTRLARTKPIKGTRPRGRSSGEDARLAEELHHSEKDRAENLMIVDMERNDLGRVAEYGTVTVPKLWEIETHPNVFQMVSTVEAKLAREFGPVDLLRACFPGGSITGAPKIRAMQIIEELEPHRRGIYTGSAGFIDFRGRADLNIVIRSFLVDGGRAYFHAGGGVVTDSDPELEYQETLDKIAGLRAALKISEESE